MSPREDDIVALVAKTVGAFGALHIAFNNAGTEGQFGLLTTEQTVGREGLWERLSAEDLRALTPLFHGHINPYGQFALDLDRPSFLEAA